MTSYTVAAGETVTGIILNVSDTQNVYGTAINTTIDYGEQYVWSGGKAINTLLLFAGRQYVYGIADNTIANSTQTIFDGGIATNTTVNFLQYVESGGAANFTTIENGSFQTIYSGGMASNTTIKHGASQTVDSGATSINTTINGSALRIGYQFVHGTATNTIISGGQQYVQNGGVAVSTTISDGGQQRVNGGTATGTVIHEGGLQHIHSNGTAHNTTIDGGVLDLWGKATGTISFGEDGTLLIEEVFSGKLSSFGASLADFGVGDTIDLRGLLYDAGHEPELSGSHLTVSNDFQSVRFTLISPQATTFVASDDGHGGTMLTVPIGTHGDAYVVQQGHLLTVALSAGLLANDVNESTALLLSGPTHGSLQLVSGGNFSYTPTAGFHGIDSFTYQAGNNGSSPANEQVTLYVVPVTVGATTTLDLLALTADEQIAATYVAFFGRAPDDDGHVFWVNEFNVGKATQSPSTLFANIASSFGISDEAKALYPFLTNPFAASDSQIGAFLESVYDNLFNRASDAAGLAYWTGQIKQTLQAGQFVGSILVNIIGGAQDSAAGLDITTLMGKVAVSLAFVHEQQEHDTVWAGAADVAAATALLDPVGSDQLSVLVGVRNAETLIAAHT